MGSRSRRKGAAWEREVANRLSEACGVEARRCMRDAFQAGNVGDVESELPLAIQAKVGQRIHFWTALDEAQEAALAGEVPLVTAKRNGAGSRPPREVCVVEMDDVLRWLRLMREAGIPIGRP